MRSWPLRWTIPTIALVLVLLTEFVIGASVLVILNRTLTSQVDHKLAEAATTLGAHPAAIIEVVDQAPAGEMPIQPPNDVVVSVFNADGTPATGATSRLNNGRPVPPIPLNPDATDPYTVTVNGESWRVVTRHLEATDGTPSSTIAVMSPLRDIGSASSVLSQGMIVLGLAIAALAAALAAWATRRSLRPLAEAERTAAAIAGGDLTQRVPSYARTTEAGALAASLNAMLDRLSAMMTERDASDARLRRFVSDASHELRTPLAAIRGYAELHRMGADQSGEAVSRIEANADRMASLVDDLLLLARSDEAAAVLSGNDSVNIAEIVEDIASDIRAQDPSRVVTVTADPAALIRGSHRHIAQLFANLAGNTLRYTPDGSPIELTVTREGASVVAAMRDHGPGFGEEHATRAFERFYRADASRTRQSGGAGLGLAIVAAIASAHGGSVAAADVDASEQGGGAIVTVTLPLDRGDEGETDALPDAGVVT